MVLDTPEDQDVKPDDTAFAQDDWDWKPLPRPTMTFRVFKAPDAVSAKSFLQKNPVNRIFHYLVVETPEGNYGRDIDGIYKE